jgi:hypothetical protein
MLVYLREAIEERGGLERIGSVAELRQAVLEGAIHRLRPKLLTEGAAIISIAPMLWATGVGAEVNRPMAAPVLGGLLIADGVVDIFLPVLFFAVRERRRWRLHGSSGGDRQQVEPDILDALAPHGQDQDAGEDRPGTPPGRHEAAEGGQQHHGRRGRVAGLQQR